MILFVFEGVNGSRICSAPSSDYTLQIEINTKKRQWKNLQKHQLMNI